MSNLRSMEQLLLREQEALKNQNTEYIQSIQQQKNHLTEAAEQATNDAQLAVNKLGYEPTPNGLKYCLNELGKDNDELAAIQQDLSEILYRCIKLNNKNGQLLNAASHEVREILSVLRTDNNDQVSTYNINGKTDNSISKSYTLNTV